MYGICTKLLAAISPGTIPINNQINVNASTQSSTGNRNDVSFQPCTECHPARESCICFPRASPVPSSPTSAMREQQEEAAVFWISLPRAAEQLLACSILRSVHRLGMVHSMEGGQGVRDPATHPARCPSPGFKAALLVPSRSPERREGTTGCQMAAASHSLMHLPYFPQKEQSCPQNDAFCWTADQR